MNTRTAPPEWMTVGQAAQYLGVAQTTFRTWVDSDKVPSFTTPGGHRRVTREALDTFISPGPSAPHMPGGRAPLVLVIDDDADVRTMLRTCLEAGGFEVAVGDSVHNGMLEINKRIPDLLMLDICMPGADGWTMLKMIREKLDVAELPIVVFSGQDDLRDAERRGAQGYLHKPFDPNQLVSQARALITTSTAVVGV